MDTYSCLATLYALQPHVVGEAAKSQEDETETVMKKWIPSMTGKSSASLFLI
jgi:hypothetical protein